MNESILVSVTNSNPANLNALKIMLKSLLMHSVNFSEIVVLCPTGEMPLDFLNWLRQKGVGTHFYDCDTSEDPYTVKFLLSNFLTDRRPLPDTLLYMDPDHVIRAPIEVQSLTQPNALQVSSEVHTISQHDIDSSIHNNTSFIFGNSEAWGKVVSAWADKYESIKDRVSVRFREEIAFCKAADATNVKLFPVSKAIQSNFQSFDSMCRSFHYGGSSSQSARIKQCLTNESSMVEQLKSAVAAGLEPLQAWVIQELLAILTCNRE